MKTTAERIASCNHHALNGWALEVVYDPSGRKYFRCRRCGGVFYHKWPLEQALTEEPQDAA